MASVVAVVAIGCGDFADEGELGVHDVIQALVVAEHSVLETNGYDFTEPSGAIIKVGSSDWQTVVFSNIDDGTVFRRDYGCWRNNFGTRRDFNETSGLARGYDSSLATDWNGTNEMFQLWIPTQGNGLRLFRSTNPCPSSGTATWDTWGWTNLATGIDFPTLVDDINNEHLWYVANQPISGTDKVIVGRFVEGTNGTTFTHQGPYAIPSGNGGSGECPVSAHVLRNPRAVMVGDDLWITYRNTTASDIEFIKFDTPTKTFDCSTKRDVDTGATLPATVTCGTCGTAQYVMATVADGCKKINRDAKIDVSDPSATTPVAVVTWSELADSTSCTTDIQMVIARSTDGGASWVKKRQTVCETGVHSSVAFARTPESGTTSSTTVFVAELSESGTSPSGGTGLRPRRWKSTDSGDSWFLPNTPNTNGWFGTTQTTFPTVNGNGSCYWGDYEGVVADAANSTIFPFWADGDNGGNPDWEIRAEGMDF